MLVEVGGKAVYVFFYVDGFLFSDAKLVLVAQPYFSNQLGQYRNLFWLLLQFEVLY